MPAAGRAPGRKHILEGSAGGTRRQRRWAAGSIPLLGAAASDSHLTYFSNYFYPDCSSWQVSKWQCDFVCCLQFPPLRVSRRESSDLARGGDTSQFSSVCKCQLRCCERCSPGHRSLVTHTHTRTHTHTHTHTHVSRCFIPYILCSIRKQGHLPDHTLQPTYLGVPTSF